jgi:hypothetical protein
VFDVMHQVLVILLYFNFLKTNLKDVPYHVSYLCVNMVFASMISQV